MRDRIYNSEEKYWHQPNPFADEIISNHYYWYWSLICLFVHVNTKLYEYNGFESNKIAEKYETKKLMLCIKTPHSMPALPSHHHHYIDMKKICINFHSFRLVLNVERFVRSICIHEWNISCVQWARCHRCHFYFPPWEKEN